MSASRPERPEERQAVALRYDANADEAPRVLAKGRGELAERILSVARENGVPIHAEGDLVRWLALCELGDEIPAELYAAVAEVLSLLWRVNGDLAPSEG